jgi:hypothetical protein
VSSSRLGEDRQCVLGSALNPQAGVVCIQQVTIGEQAGLLSHDRFEDCRALHRVEGTGEVIPDNSCEARSAWRTFPTYSILPGTPTPSWRGHRLRLRSGVAARTHRPTICIHTLAIAFGRTPPVGFVVVTRQQSSSYGRCWRRSLTMAFMRRRTVMQAMSAKVAAPDHLRVQLCLPSILKNDLLMPHFQ